MATSGDYSAGVLECRWSFRPSLYALRHTDCPGEAHERIALFFSGLPALVNPLSSLLPFTGRSVRSNEDVTAEADERATGHCLGSPCEFGRPKHRPEPADQGHEGDVPEKAHDPKRGS